MLGINNQTASAACVAIAALYGFFSGAVVSLWSPVLPTVSRAPHEYGMRFGMVFLIMGPCGLLSGPIAGWLLGNSFRWERAIAFSAVRSHLKPSNLRLMASADFDHGECGFVGRYAPHHQPQNENLDRLIAF